MSNYSIRLNDLAPAGQSFVFADQQIWTGPIAEFALACSILQPIQAEVFCLPQDAGVLVRGKIGGQVSLPCDRCAEATTFDLEHSFDEFEGYLAPVDMQGLVPGEDYLPESELIRLESGGPVLDIGDLLWEEFCLALPVKPLCTDDCKGVCSTCGANLNRGDCACAQDAGDPRLAVLRKLKGAQSGN